MPYKLTRHANHTVEVDAHLEPDAVNEARREIVSTVRRRARVPGFRPGRAPEGAVRARYADEIREELEELLSKKLWSEVVAGEDGIDPIGPPEITGRSFDADGEFRFSLKLEVRPRYELPEIEEGTLPEIDLEVRPDEIDEEIAKLQKQHATWEPVEDEGASDGMLVEADLHGQLEDSDQEPYREDDARFVIGDDAAPPEINEALQGARAGDQRVASKRFPDDDENRDRAGKTVRYTIDVKALKREVLPPVDDDLASAVGVEALDTLKERIVEGLERRKHAQRREAWRRHLLDMLETGIDANELPSSLVQAAVEEDVNRLAYALAMRGASLETDDINWQEIAARAEPDARRKVLDTLILEQLAETWNVPVPEAEVEAFVVAEAQQLGVPPAEHKANLAKEGKIARVRHAARVSATVDEMIRRAGGEVD